MDSHAWVWPLELGIWTPTFGNPETLCGLFMCAICAPSGPKTFVHKGRVVAVHDTQVTVKWATDKNHAKVTTSEVRENEEAAWAAFHKAQMSSSHGSARGTRSGNSDTS